MFTIVFYETPTGLRPATEFILSLPKKLQAKAIRDIDILADHERRPTK